MNWARRGGVFLGSFSMLLSACGGQVDGGDDLATSAGDPIINGTPIDMATSGVVRLTNGCSGTLITNQKVLTAAHCVRPYQTNPNGGTPTSPFSVFMGSQWSNASKAWLHPNSSIDAAVVWLANPFTMNGSTTGYRRNTPKVTADQLHNGALIIDGYGPTGPGGFGLGTLARGVCSAKKRATGLLSCFPSGNPPTIQAGGDSGGPGSVFTTGLPVVYIQSGCFFPLESNGVPKECYGNTSDVWRDWAIWLLL